jgi:16S rRNA (uracil1498-N3)-methyltransferase
MKRFRLPTLPELGNQTALDANGSHHLLHVLRASRGDRVLVFDGTGLQAPAILVDITAGQAIVEVIDLPHSARPPHPLHLVLGLPKGPAMDRAVRMATEAGVTDIHPVLATRSTARGDRGDRWRRIATAAAQQCGRADVPQVHPLANLTQTLPLMPSDTRIAVVGAADGPPSKGPCAVLIGPEGGWTATEIGEAQEAGALPVTLGDWVLRSDTAAAVAIAALSRHNKADTQ